MSRPAFTPEQRAAIRSRTGASLLAANAGSGKTAVMVERFAEAVRIDEVPVGAILALTFTEKAAGEFAERLKRRLTELGELEHARAVDAAWIGTIHGFCARVLRTQPLAAGLDPNFTVLDEPAASRVAAAAYEDALNAWGRGARRDRPRRLLRPGAARPRARRLRVPARPRQRAPAARDPGVRAAARRRRAGGRPPRPRCDDLKLAGAGMRVSAGRDALAACREVLAGSSSRVPWPGELDAAELKRGAKALESDACEAYRGAWTAYRVRLRRLITPGPPSPSSTPCWTASGPSTRPPRRTRAAVDFEDLELRVRDLLADAAVRERWAERFQLLMVDEFQDTNGVQLEILEALERDNLFAVGDEFQSIYRFRHADVGIFRARAATLGPRARPRPRRQLPLARGAARRPQRDVRARAGRRGSRRCAPAASSPGGRRSCACSSPVPRPASRPSSCSSPTPSAGRRPTRASGSRPAATSRGVAPKPA